MNYHFPASINLLTIVCLTMVVTNVQAAEKMEIKSPEAAKTRIPQHPDGPEFNWDHSLIQGKSYVRLGKIKEFYQLSDHTASDSWFTLENASFAVKFPRRGQQVVVNDIILYLSEPVATFQGNHHLSLLDLKSLVDPVLRPGAIPSTGPLVTVILDAGHGGRDRGAAGLESGLTLSLAQKISPLLEQRGFKVILTRNADQHLPLAERLRRCNTVDQAILVSLHFNSGNKAVSGFETYVISAHANHPRGNAAMALAYAVHSQAITSLKQKNLTVHDRGIRHAKFRLLKDCIHPAILVEAGFLTHEKESGKIKSAKYQQALARAIVDGVTTYNRRLKEQAAAE